MRRSCLQVTAFVLGCAACATATPALDWKTAGAIRTAPQDQQFLLYFQSSDSPLCKELEEDVWKDPVVTKASSSFLPVRLDCATAETKPMLARFQVYRVPTIIVGRRDGSVVRRLERASEKETILKFLRGEPIPVAVADAGTKKASTASKVAAEATDATGDATPPASDLTGVQVTRTADGYEVAVTLAATPAAGNLATQTLYFNTDSSATTGYTTPTQTVGAEYMIQGGSLFHFIGQKQEEWAWDPKGQVPNRTEGERVVYAIASSAIGSPASGFSLFVSTQNEKWDLLDWAPDAKPLIVPAAGAAAPKADSTPDANAPAGERIADPTGDAAGEFDIAGVTYSSNRESVIVTLEMVNAGGGGIPHVFIDPDADSNTGYGDGIRLGADFMIEGGTLYRHDTPGWNWKPMGEVKPAVDGKRITYTIPRSRVGLDVNRPGKYWFTITDKAWAPADFVPDSETVTIP